ncbi:MAG: Nif3-like dinuclear metal center hexameric protein [Deltaproteobacteria bacterium]|nr:Nif3-like dinuclear metal center hexameric protein [Deltaproteobacteria bacterium]NIS78529.1 Nif3-like dinuclear metal center hexameric protein [Deltaproteobacteria bacterium]
MVESKRPAVKDILMALDKRFPFGRAASWDNVGLLAGEKGKKVERILVSVDVTPRLIDRAISSQYDLIITHHPLFLEPVRRVTDEAEEGLLLVKILRNGISLICAHTNADLSPVGVSRELAERIGLVNQSPLGVATRVKQHKVVVFVPPADVGKVLGQAFLAGAGQIGQYTSCSFRTAGTGTFFPEQEARPYLGEVGELNSVAEERVEFVADDRVLPGVLDAVKKSHPYEEPAIDVYPLATELPDGWLGIRGELSREMTLEEFLTHVRDSVRPTTIRHTGDLGTTVRKVGVLAGSGGGFVENVVGTDVDVFVTGDLKHHQAHRLAHASIIAVDIGHFDSEKFIMERFKDVIEEDFGGSVTVDTFDEPTEYMRVFR